MTKPESPARAEVETPPESSIAEDALDALRHNRTHTIPPGARVDWLTHQLPRLTEDHLSATDETTTAALGVATPPTPTPQIPRRALAIVLGVVAVSALAVWFTGKTLRPPTEPTKPAIASAPPPVVTSPSKPEQTAVPAEVVSAVPDVAKHREPGAAKTTNTKLTPPPKATPDEFDPNEALFKPR